MGKEEERRVGKKLAKQLSRTPEVLTKQGFQQPRVRRG